MTIISVENAVLAPLRRTSGRLVSTIEREKKSLFVIGRKTKDVEWTIKEL